MNLFDTLCDFYENSTLQFEGDTGGMWITHQKLAQVHRNLEPGLGAHDYQQMDDYNHLYCEIMEKECELHFRGGFRMAIQLVFKSLEP